MRFIGRAGAARNGVRQRRFRDVTVGVSKTPHPTNSQKQICIPKRMCGGRLFAWKSDDEIRMKNVRTQGAAEGGKTVTQWVPRQF